MPDEQNRPSGSWLLLVPAVLTLAPVYLPAVLGWLAPLPLFASDPFGFKDDVISRGIAAILVACYAQAWFIAAFVFRPPDRRDWRWKALGVWIFVACVPMTLVGGYVLATVAGALRLVDRIPLIAATAIGVAGLLAVGVALARGANKRINPRVQASIESSGDRRAG